MGRPVGGVGVSSDRSADGAAGVDGAADGAKVTVSSGAAAPDPPRAIVGTGAGAAGAGGPDARPAPQDALPAPPSASGASQSTRAGGSSRTADAGRPCQTYCSASTPP